jgi:hypothetical protein
MLLDKRGDIYAWVAALMLFVAVPLASLSIDIVRMMYVRGHLHTATDAACQAAVNTLDASHFTSTGEARIDMGRGRTNAVNIFRATLVDVATVRYTESLVVDFPGPRLAHCTSTAKVDHMIPMTPTMNVVVETTSEMRGNYGN